MNTPSHMLIGAAAFARPASPATLLASLAGGFAPDLPMLAMVLWARRIAGVPEREVFGQLYFSDRWQAVFAVDHGFFVWGALFALALWRKLPVMAAFAGSGLMHAAADFLTHNDDARRQFWPVSDWVFQSPVSYWDARFYGGPFAIFEFALALALTGFLLWRLRGVWPRVLVLATAAPLILPVLLTGGFHGLHGMG